MFKKLRDDDREDRGFPPFDDFIIGSRRGDTLTGGNGKDLIIGGGGNDRLEGRGGNDRVFGGNGADHLDGGEGDDWLFGERGDDNLDGGAGNDILLGGKGNDTLTGGDGFDTFVVRRFDRGTDTITDLGLGDVLDVSAFTRREVSLSEDGDGNTQVLDHRGRVLAVIEDVLPDALQVNQDGTVSLDLQGGVITDDGVLENSVDGTYDGSGYDIDQRITGGLGDDVITTGDGNDTIFGGGGNDTLFGGAGDDVLNAQDGDDTVYGGAGDDFMGGAGEGDDTYDGNTGSDTVSYESTTLGVFVDLSGQDLPPDFQGFATGPEIGNDILISIQNIIGGGGSDFVFGDSADNSLKGAQTMILSMAAPATTH